jgi:hypothetical protein
VEDAVLAPLFIIQDELNRDPGAAGPIGLRWLSAITYEVARIGFVSHAGHVPRVSALSLHQPQGDLGRSDMTRNITNLSLKIPVWRLILTVSRDIAVDSCPKGQHYRVQGDGPDGVPSADEKKRPKGHIWET